MDLEVLASGGESADLGAWQKSCVPIPQGCLVKEKENSNHSVNFKMCIPNEDQHTEKMSGTKQIFKERPLKKITLSK